MLTTNEIEKLYNVRKVGRKYCEKCDHSVSLSNRTKYIICSYCSNIIFKNKNEEFKYRMREQIIKERRNRK